jgi:tetratricopeptide (TPR) repeat protein
MPLIPCDIDRLIASADEILALQTNESLQLAKLAQMQAHSIGYIQGEVRAGLIFGKAQLILGELQGALNTLQLTLLMAEDGSLEKAQLLEQIARGHFDLGDSTLAAKLWQECTQIALVQQHFSPLIHAHIGLGQIHFGFENYPAALHSHYQAFEYLHTGSSTELRCRVYANIVLDLLSLERQSEAAAMLQRLQDAALTQRSLSTDIETYRLKGLLDLANQQVSDARSHFATALKICHLQANPWSEAMSLLGLGRCDLADQAWAAALAHLNKALEIACGLQNPHLLCKIHFALSSCYEGLNELHTAKIHLTEYLQFKQLLQPKVS